VYYVHCIYKIGKKCFYAELMSKAFVTHCVSIRIDEKIPVGVKADEKFL
jgi:hypothetical protein